MKNIQKWYVASSSPLVKNKKGIFKAPKKKKPQTHQKHKSKT